VYIYILFRVRFRGEPSEIFFSSRYRYYFRRKRDGAGRI